MDEKIRLVITGASGFIGRELLKTLSRVDTHEVLAIGNRFDETLCLSANIKFHEVDIFSTEAKDLIRKFNPTSCLHLAWKDGFNHKSEYHLNSIGRHFKFIEFIADLPDFRKISVAGTSHEVGPYHGQVDSSTPDNPVNFYGISKVALRRALEIHFSDKKYISFQWLRMFYILPNDQSGNSVFAKILKAEENGLKSFPFTSGENLHDFIDIDSLSKIIIEIIELPLTGIINCGSYRPQKIKDVVNYFVRKNNININVEYGAYPSRIDDSPAIWGISPFDKKNNE